MYDTSGSYSVCCAAPPDINLAERLNCLGGELARQTVRRKPVRPADEWRALRSVNVGDALTAPQAYAWFGTFLGLFPPLAIFGRILFAFHTYRPDDGRALLYWGALFLVMNLVCCAVGRKMGRFLARKLVEQRPQGLPALLLRSFLMSIAWGVTTGAAGGAVGLIIGAVVGVACAVPVAAAAFPVFALLHRAHTRDGMIEEGRLWPLAFGVPLTATALILSPWLM